MENDKDNFGCRDVNPDLNIWEWIDIKNVVKMNSIFVSTELQNTVSK